jgi:beta-galactosidase
LLGGLTEFWRAHRSYAGVLHFVSLTSSFPGVYTSDNFRDIERLELEPHFADYVEQAFKPLGVYIDFWQPEIKAGANRRFTIMMINDDADAKSGKLLLTLENAGGSVAARAELLFELAGLGQQSYQVDLDIPNVSGEFLVKAAAWADGAASPTISRRQVKITAQKGK